MKIAIGSDHAAYEFKLKIIHYIEEIGHSTNDVGCFSNESVDYPIYAKKASLCVAKKECDLGILICGSGIGMAIAANKIKGIRALNCSDPVVAKLARNHNNANVLTLGARIIGLYMAKEIVHAFLNAKFEKDRHIKRVKMIEDMEY